MDTERQLRTRAIFERTAIEFLDGELDLCETFLNVADIEFDDLERKTLAKIKAQKGYETVVAWIGDVHSGTDLDRLTGKLSRLKERLSRYPI